MLIKFSELHLMEDSYYMVDCKRSNVRESLFIDFEDGSSPLQMHSASSIDEDRLRAYVNNDGNFSVYALLHY